MKKCNIILCLLFFAGSTIAQQQHPSIMLTGKNVEAVREGIKKYPLLKSSFEDLKKHADKAIASPINVPTPADGGGGITHEQHKENYKQAVSCGIAYQLTKDKRYAEHVK